MPQYKVLAKNNIAQQGRWLEPGETVEMDEKTAREEFPGRLATMDDVVVRKDVETDALAALVVVLLMRRPHERVSLIEERLAQVAADDPVRPRLEEMLATAQREAAEDQKRHEERATAVTGTTAAAPAEKPAAPRARVAEVPQGKQSE